MASRRMAREQALQALYTVAVGDRAAADALAEVVPETAPGDHRAFVRELVQGTIEHQDESDATIVPLLQGWSIERLPVLDRLILRMGTFELRHHRETPAPVVINEAVELAKKYSTEESGKYVNGVLSAVVREHAKAP